MWCAAEVQGDVLFGYQAGSDASAQVLVQEACDLGRGDVLATFKEPAGEDGDGVGVRLYKFGEDFGEADFVFEVADGAALPGEQGRERMLVVVVDFADVGVGHDDVGQVAQRLDAVGQPDR
jgi:hypothetical protein